MKRSLEFKSKHFKTLIPGDWCPVAFAGKITIPRLTVVKVLQEPFLQVKTKEGKVYTAIFSAASGQAYSDDQSNTTVIPRKIVALDNNRPVIVNLVKQNDKEYISRGGTLYNFTKNSEEFWYTIGTCFSFKEENESSV